MVVPPPFTGGSHPFKIRCAVEIDRGGWCFPTPHAFQAGDGWGYAGAGGVRLLLGAAFPRGRLEGLQIGDFGLQIESGRQYEPSIQFPRRALSNKRPSAPWPLFQGVARAAVNDGGSDKPSKGRITGHFSGPLVAGRIPVITIVVLPASARVGPFRHRWTPRTWSGT